MDLLNFRYLIQRIEVDVDDVGGGGGGGACPPGFYYDDVEQSCVLLPPDGDDGGSDNAFTFRRIVGGTHENPLSPSLESVVASEPLGVFGTTNVYPQGVYQKYDSVLFAWNFNCTQYDDEYNSANYPGDATYNPYTLRAAGNISFSDWLSASTGDSDRRRMLQPTSPGGGGNELWSPSEPHRMSEFLDSVLFDITLFPEADLDSDDGLQELEDGGGFTVGLF